MKESQEPVELMNELEELQACRSAVTDLMSPCDDLHIVNRSNLTQLLRYLDGRERKVVEHLRPHLRLANSWVAATTQLPIT